MFSFFDYIFNTVSGFINFIVDLFKGLFRIITMVDDLSGTIMNAVNALPDVFGVYALTSISIIAVLGIFKLVLSGGGS